MANDGQVAIDLSLRREGVQSDIEWLTENLKNIGANFNPDEITQKFESAMGDAKETVKSVIDDINGEKAEPEIDANDDPLKEKTSESKEHLASVNGTRATAKLKADATELLEKAEHSKEALRHLPKSVRTEIIAQARENGILNFGKLLKKLPNKVITELVANIKDGKAIEFDDILQKIPKEKVTTLRVNDEASEPTQRITEHAEKAKSNMNGFSHTLQDTAIGMGVYNVAMRAGAAISNEFAGAISRYDTLNNYPKVLESMGVSAQDANQSMSILKKGVDGLPTSLDEVAKVSQRLIPMSKNAQDASKSALALNDAFLASGASAEDTSRGLEQYIQMLASGKVDMMSWRTLEETMPASLRKVAQSFHIAGGSTQELYKRLQSGKITMRELNEHFQELDKGANGFHSTALKTTGGIGTAFRNMGNRMKAGIQVAIAGFDDLVKSISGKSIAQNINSLTSHFSSFGKIVAKVFKDLGKAIKPIMPAIKPLLPVLTTFATALIGLTVARAVGRGIIFLARSFLNLGNGLNRNLEVAAIAAFISALVELYKHNAKFRAFVNGIINSAKNFAKNFEKYFKGAINGVTKLLKGDLGWEKGISSNLKQISHTIGKESGNWITLFKRTMDQIIQPVKKAFSGIYKYIEPDLKRISKIISSSTKTISSIWSKCWSGLSKVIMPIFNAISKFVNGHMKQIKSIINSGLNVIHTIWNGIWQQIANVFKLVWDLIFHRSRVIKDIRNIISTEIRIIKSIWQNIWNIIKNYFNIVWDGIKDVARTAINFVKDIISNTVKTIQNVWNNIWNAIKSFFGNIWDGIKTAAKNNIEAVHDAIKGTLDKIHDAWQSMWSGLSSFFGGIWKDIKQFAQDGINGVLHVINAGIDGIDAVWKFFTGHETSIHHLKPVHFSQGGIVDRHLSMVNDGSGADWKELIETPSGELMMSNERNAVLPLEPGTRVYNGEETRQIMTMLGVDHYANGGIVGGIKHYADGGIVGDLINWGGHELKDFGKWIKDKWDAITKFLKHPLENTKAIISKAITKPLNAIKNSNMVQLGKGVFDKLTQPIADWFKKGLQKAKDDHDKSSGGFGKAPDLKNGAQLHDIIKNALQANGLPTGDDYINAWLRQVATESGGNAHAVQPGADPDGDGSGPALGLLQTKRSTFNANKFPGHDDIFNAYDNALAAIHYAKGRYGSDMLGVIGHGHGYDNGGVIDKKELAWIAENNREFVINPQRATADNLLKQAAEERLAYDPNSEIAKAITGINAAQSSNGYVAPNTAVSNHYTNTTTNEMTNGTSPSNARPVNISVELDGRTIANASYPYQKMLQASDIRIQARKGGGAFV